MLAICKKTQVALNRKWVSHFLRDNCGQQLSSMGSSDCGFLLSAPLLLHPYCLMGEKEKKEIQNTGEIREPGKKVRSNGRKLRN